MSSLALALSTDGAIPDLDILNPSRSTFFEKSYFLAS